MKGLLSRYTINDEITRSMAVVEFVGYGDEFKLQMTNKWIRLRRIVFTFTAVDNRERMILRRVIASRVERFLGIRPFLVYCTDKSPTFYRND